MTGVYVHSMRAELTKECVLAGAARVPEPCWGGSCAFWQNGGDDLEAGCSAERLELDHQGVDVADLLRGLR